MFDFAAQAEIPLPAVVRAAETAAVAEVAAAPAMRHDAPARSSASAVASATSTTPATTTTAPVATAAAASAQIPAPPPQRRQPLSTQPPRQAQRQGGCRCDGTQRGAKRHGGLLLAAGSRRGTRVHTPLQVETVTSPPLTTVTDTVAADERPRLAARAASVRRTEWRRGY